MSMLGLVFMAFQYMLKGKQHWLLTLKIQGGRRKCDVKSGKFAYKLPAFLCSNALMYTTNPQGP